MNTVLPWYARSVFVGGRPLVLVAALVMSVPGEIRMAEIAGWHGWVTWLMPICVSAYAACAAVISDQRRRAKAPGQITANLGAGAALGLALAAQVVAHLIDRGYMPTSAALVAIVSSVPPLVVAHMLHMAAVPASELMARDRAREAEETSAFLAAELAEALDLAGLHLTSKCQGAVNGYAALTEEAVVLAGEAGEVINDIEGELAETGQADGRARRKGGGKTAIPLAVVKETVAAMTAEGAKINGSTLAKRLRCSERSGYRYLASAQAA